MNTNTTARDEILGRLRAARRGDLPMRPGEPPLAELSWSRKQLMEKFVENLVEQTAFVHRVKDYAEAADRLADIAAAEHLSTLMASTDRVLEALNLTDWEMKTGVRVLTVKDFVDRDAYKDAVFDEVGAGITGVDYAVAESGTLCLIHDANQPRLVSLAPIVHIAIVPADRIYPVYEDVIDKMFDIYKPSPSHVTFITGPSMTADIQGVPFKGMHGPKRLMVIVIG